MTITLIPAIFFLCVAGFLGFCAGVYVGVVVEQRDQKAAAEFDFSSYADPSKPYDYKADERATELHFVDPNELH